MKKIFLALLVSAITFGTFSFAAAASIDLAGYIYTDGTGWISLNCANANSCQTINYKVSNNSGSLSGYGYSEASGWINFNPKFGGVSVNANNEITGWAYSQNNGWVYISGAKAASSKDLQASLSTTENSVDQIGSTVGAAALSSSGVIDLLKTFCEKLFSASQCAGL